MIRQDQSLATAQAVINLINSGDRITHLKNDWWIQSYQNGREQGFMVTDILNVAYYICQHRNSDDICIYKGKYTSSMLSADAYNHPILFGRDFDRTSNWLISELESFEQ